MQTKEKLGTLPKARARRARARTRARPFRAFDGEGADIDGRHELVTLSCSLSEDGTGTSITNPNGLSSFESLTFLVRQARSAPKSIPVAFFFNYDVNMILRDVPIEQLRELWETGETVWQVDAGEFALTWIPTKLFEVAAELDTPAGRMRAGCKIYDSFGFFQSSFVKAAHAWELGDELAQIEAMKERRGSFGTSPGELAELAAYSERECVVLCRLMEKVRVALHDVELRPRTWLGAGAIASALLAREGVDSHLTIRPKQNGLDDATMRAYFGGRTEVFQQGVQPHAISADINSAYPYAATQLPTEIGEWKRRRDYEPAAPWAIWRVAWKIPRDSLLAPLPFRDRRSIFFPNEGEGYYHASEVAAAIALYGDAIDVSTGYVFEPATDAKPFAFLADVYAYRQQLKADGHAGEKVLKLGINSVYGKLAQGNSRDGRRPKFQSYFWAGAITAATRARVLHACALAPENVVAVATDGIVFAPDAPAELVAQPGLGGWELTGYRDFFVAQPGMYHATQADTDEEVKHSRGFFTRELDFDVLRELWAERGPVSSWASSSTRFMGLGASLVRKDFAIWRQWVTGDRRVSLYLAPRKRYDDEEPAQAKRLWPCDRTRAGVSDVYVPKHQAVELDEAAIDWIEGNEQPSAG